MASIKAGRNQRADPRENKKSRIWEKVAIKSMLHEKKHYGILFPMDENVLSFALWNFLLIVGNHNRYLPISLR